MRVEKLGILIELSKGKKHQETKDPKARRYLQIEDLNGNKNHKYTFENGVFVQIDDIILAWDGANAGKVGTGLTGIIGSTLARMIIDKKEAFPRYIYWFLHSKFEFIKSKRTGATIPHVSNSAIRNLQVPLPSLPDQKRIAIILDNADAIRRINIEILKKYNHLAQSVFLEMVVDPWNNPKGWPKTSLGEIADIIMGQSPPGDSYNSLGKGSPLLNGPTEFGVKYPEEKQWTTSPTKFCKKGDILFCVRGATAGRMNIADKQYCLGRGLAAIRGHNEATNRLVFMTLEHLYEYFQRTSNGSTFINIGKDTLNELPILEIPSQRLTDFSEIISNIDHQKELMQDSLNKSEYLFQSLLQRVFKGEL
jgi:type I restriction enzyme S subunit